jgi:hypothetical protein
LSNFPDTCLIFTTMSHEYKNSITWVLHQYYLVIENKVNVVNSPPQEFQEQPNEWNPNHLKASVRRAARVSKLLCEQELNFQMAWVWARPIPKNRHCIWNEYNLSSAYSFLLKSTESIDTITLWFLWVLPLEKVGCQWTWRQRWSGGCSRKAYPSRTYSLILGCDSCSRREIVHVLCCSRRMLDDVEHLAFWMEAMDVSVSDSFRDVSYVIRSACAPVGCKVVLALCV